MNKDSQKLCKYAGVFSAICGGLLISVSAISQTAVAQQPTSVTPRQSTSKVNPCPSIFYEEPHNNRVLVPQGCPPNAITQRFANQGMLPAARAATPSPYQTGFGVGGETPQTGTTKINPCPQIYYEEPFNTRNPVPQGCPPNAFSQRQQQQRETSTQVPFVPPSSTTTTPTPSVIQPPLPSQQQAPSATIALANGRVNINLVNDTGGRVTYQVIGETEPRSLQGGSNVMLQDISAPVTVTFQREDGGLLLVTPQASSEQPGMLVVTLNEATDVAQDIKAMRIQQNGTVLLN
ncbi:hypothetical protein IQ259_16540 [Fortiea sp. LEGE XX443]|uniref:hypothetical protein n=1 Tax=Fortiea sp. LEGE XX443 TaxID=1828611 RepID=UPI001880F63F|nr:hypothetical protein [Fortiea sp. LEGE XX443]MBE9006629.1 hypothetical protein [Fortiea sp. LEGE XX443]